MESRPYGSNWLGAALGLVATGAGLAAAEVVVGLVEGSASPVVPVGQEFIDHVPKWMKDWAIEQFGTNDKAVLIAGAIVVVLVLGVTVGIMAIRGARAGAYAPQSYQRELTARVRIASRRHGLHRGDRGDNPRLPDPTPVPPAAEQLSLL